AERVRGFMSASAFDDGVRRIDPCDSRAAARKSAGDVTVAAGQVQHREPNDVADELEQGRIDQLPVPRIALVALPLVIPTGHGLPDVLHRGLRPATCLEE